LAQVGGVDRSPVSVANSSPLPEPAGFDRQPPTTTIMSLTRVTPAGHFFGQLLQRRTGGLFGHLCALAGTALSDTDPLKGRLAVSAISQIGMDDTRAAAIT
jgi:hypothetical protein